MLSLIGYDVFNDLEFFQSYDNQYKDSVLYLIEKNAFNKYCISFISSVIKKPIYNIDCLIDRQNMIKHCTEEMSSVLPNLRFIQSNQHIIDWFKDKQKSEIVNIYDQIFFNYKIFTCLGCNKKGSVLTAYNIYNIIVSPIIGILSPLMYFIIPYMFLVYKLKLNFTFIQFMKLMYSSLISMINMKGGVVNVQIMSYLLSMFLYFQGLFNTIEIAKTSYTLSKHIYNNMSVLFEYLKHCSIVHEKCNKTKINFKEVLGCNIECSQLNFGTHLSRFKNVDFIKIINLLEKLNESVGWFSIANFKNNLDLNFSSYIDDTRAKCEGNGIWHIRLENAVGNDFMIDDRNCIITGPNAGGKSTFIKALGINVILSQTFGICAAKSFRHTPYYFINTQINIPDLAGKESLFEAEMNRCKYILNIIQHLPENHKSFILMDEIFSSTNVIEGISGAFAILQKLTSYSSITVIITTHLIYLTKLPHFVKMKMNASVTDDDIYYPYQLSYGVSKQYIALEILKNNFDQDIIDNAIQIKNKLLSS